MLSFLFQLTKKELSYGDIEEKMISTVAGRVIDIKNSLSRLKFKNREVRTYDKFFDYKF